MERYFAWSQEDLATTQVGVKKYETRLFALEDDTRKIRTKRGTYLNSSYVSKRYRGTRMLN